MIEIQEKSREIIHFKIRNKSLLRPVLPVLAGVLFSILSLQLLLLHLQLPKILAAGPLIDILGILGGPLIDILGILAAGPSILGQKYNVLEMSENNNLKMTENQIFLLLLLLAITIAAIRVHHKDNTESITVFKGLGTCNMTRSNSIGIHQHSRQDLTL